MSLKADTLEDLKLGKDRYISVGADGDLETTSGVETVEQSVAIRVSPAVKELVGEDIDGESLTDLEAQIERAMGRDEQIESVNRVDVIEVNRSTNTVVVDVFGELNNGFTAELTIP